MGSRYFEKAAHAKLYAKFRPSHPPSLINKMVDYCRNTVTGALNLALDIGCGSGQSTRLLSSHFEEVIGFDISNAQIDEANKANTMKNLNFRVSPAETLPIKNNSVQMMTCGQSVHWLDVPKFFKEADRVLVPGGVLALYMYDIPMPVFGDKTKELERIIRHEMYDNKLAKYFGRERKYIDGLLTDPKFIIPYPDYQRIDTIQGEKTSTVMEYQGYIRSWSGFQNYVNVHGKDDGEEILENLVKDIMKTIEAKTSPDETKFICKIPYILLIGSKPR